MSEIVLLPFEVNPIIRGYQYTAFPMSIIQGNAMVDIMPWLCCQHINCCYNTNDVPDKYSMSVCVSESYYYCRGENKLKLQHICLEKETYKNIGLDLIILVKNFIKLKCYVCGQCNERYINGKSAYGRYDFMHDYILYGYDDRKKVFFSAGYLKDNKYSKFEIEYKSYEKSLLYTSDKNIEFNIWKYNENAEYNFDIDRVKIGLYNYINSTCSQDVFINGYIYGISSIIELKRYFENILNGEFLQSIKLTYTQNLLEHEYIMMKCMEYMKNNISNKLDEISHEYVAIYKKSLLIHNIAIKYNLQNKKTSIETIITLLDEIVEFEQSKLPIAYNIVNLYTKNRVFP